MERAERIAALMARGWPAERCWAFVVEVERDAVSARAAGAVAGDNGRA